MVITLLTFSVEPPSSKVSDILGDEALPLFITLEDAKEDDEDNMKIREKIARSKYIDEEELFKIDDIITELNEAIEKLIQEGGILDA